MAMRAFALPADIPVLVELLPPSFKYPENEAWNIQEDEAESMVESFKAIQGIWPLIRLLQLVYAPLKDLMRGFVWEEDGKPVAVTNVIRKGSTDQWIIGNVSVLPEYRRRGIARQLVEESVQYAHSRGASRIMLDVIDGNLPAQALYEKLGFEVYSGETHLNYGPHDAPAPVALSDDYTLAECSLFDWRDRFDLAQRITPEAVAKYRPVEEGSYKQPVILRPFLPIVFKAMGSRPHPFEVRRKADGLMVASMMCNTRSRKGGTNQLDITLDPAHGAIAPALVNFMLRHIEQSSPGRRVEFSAPKWQQPTLTAALDAGFTHRYDYVSMGIIPDGK
jgi:GNAT superfamily N-acetyltransferase